MCKYKVLTQVCLFQSLCSSFCATLPQCPSLSHLVSTWVTTLFSISEKSTLVQTAARDRTVSVPLISSFPFHSLSTKSCNLMIPHKTWGSYSYCLCLSIFLTQWAPSSCLYQSSPSPLPYHSFLEDTQSSDHRVGKVDSPRSCHNAWDNHIGLWNNEATNTWLKRKQCQKETEKSMNSESIPIMVPLPVRSINLRLLKPPQNSSKQFSFDLKVSTRR